jgi:hypothetical protein
MIEFRITASPIREGMLGARRRDVERPSTSSLVRFATFGVLLLV